MRSPYAAACKLCPSNRIDAEDLCPTVLPPFASGLPRSSRVRRRGEHSSSYARPVGDVVPPFPREPSSLASRQLSKRADSSGWRKLFEKSSRCTSPRYWTPARPASAPERVLPFPSVLLALFYKQTGRGNHFRSDGGWESCVLPVFPGPRRGG